jgi:hypothetical protein
MDDLILVGMLAIIWLYTAAALAVAAVIFSLAEFFSAVVAGEIGRAAAVLGILLLILATYTCAGLWLQRSGRI